MARLTGMDTNMQDGKTFSSECQQFPRAKMGWAERGYVAKATLTPNVIHY